MDRDDVDRFEKLSGQLLSIYEEISILSKKNPNDALNKFKLKFINDILARCNAYLDAAYRPYEDFEQFEEDDIPQNSDVVFILSQYIQCFEKLRSDNVIMKRGIWHWRVVGNDGEEVDSEGMVYIRTVKPKNLKD
jgi:hypothetical protein